MYTVIAKIVITIIFTCILCTMCKKGLGDMAWFFVLGIPVLLLIITPTPKKKKTKRHTRSIFVAKFETAIY